MSDWAEQDCACGQELDPVLVWTRSGDRAEDDCACAEPNPNPMALWSPPADRAEDDCACADYGFTPPFPHPAPSDGPWRRAPELYRAPLAHEHELAFNAHGRAGVVVLNRPARRVLDAFAMPRTPSQAALTLPDLPQDQVRRATHHLAALDLLALTCHTPRAVPIPNHTLIAWLHVADACNLDCTYCYLHKSGELMDDATGRAAVEAVFGAALRHQFQGVKLKYAGGEPLLNFGLVQTVHQQALDWARRTGLSLREVVLSNGVALSDDILDWFHDSDVRLMISLDGLGATHDTHRVFANGQGSFEQVEKSIDRALARGVHPYLSITVTAHSADQLDKVVAFALDRGLLFNLNFYRENDIVPARSGLQAENRQLITGVRQAFDVIERRLPQQSLIGALVDRASFGVPHEHACGAGRNYLVIDQRGQIARCQMEIEQPVADVWQPDPLASVRRSTRGFQNLPIQHKEGCRDCPWRTWCGGGCPLLTFRVTGHNDVRSPYCTVYQALFPEALRLEGLRLLKWGVPTA